MADGMSGDGKVAGLVEGVGTQMLKGCLHHLRSL
jgi:hypothetical protein